MDLKQELRERKQAIVGKWFDAFVATYHEDARGALGRVKEQFANPVGFNVHEGLTGLYDGMLQEVLPDTVSTFLDAIVRIRAVQEFPPSTALAFLFQVKQIIRDELGPGPLADPAVVKGLGELDAVVDQLVLYAFDLYMGCREKIYDLKAQDARNATFRLLQQAKILTERKE